MNPQYTVNILLTHPNIFTIHYQHTLNIPAIHPQHTFNINPNHSQTTLELPSMHLQTTLSPIQFACNPLLEHSKTPSMHYQYTPHILQSILKNAPKNTLNTLQAHSKHISNTPEKHFKHTSNTL